MNPVIHFEMPYDDSGRLGAFYKAVFGWQMNDMGAQMGNYVLATTVASDSNGRPTKVGAINGGFFEKKPEWPSHPSVVIGVDDIRKKMEGIAAAGGQVLGEPMDIPGVGAYVSFIDTEGNRVSMLQPLMPAKD
jgi:predicted enzyme related to lactoylglutathione lyase